jgi:parallel beta-helix repeat protein
MKNPKPVAFMSYVRFDDEYENGRLSQFRERLSGEVHAQTGEEFPIFQDRKDIEWGQNWKERVEDSIDQVTFLIPIITPSFFRSKACRDELERFLEREERLKRNDLILSVYYIDCPLLNDKSKCERDRLARVLAERQYADWRDLRFEPFTSPQVGKTLAQLAIQIRDALERVTARAEPTADNGGSREQIRTATTKVAAIHPQSPEPSLQVSPPEESISGSAELIRRPSSKTEPPMRLVDPLFRGDHATITAAIEAANPGDRIIVRPGLYEEGLVIDKPLEIIGDGDLGEIVIQATAKDAILFKTTMGRVANLTLKQMGGGEWYAVDIAQGRLELEGCDITSQSLACVAIHGGADPRLRRNRIHDGKSGGVYVYENGQGVLEDNDIFGNAQAGVAIKRGGNPTLRRNRIHDGKASGVFVYENGQGVLEDNDIFGDTKAGVAITEGGNRTLRRNRINKNGYKAVWVYSGGAGTIEDNDLRENAWGAWDISEDSKLKVIAARNIE